MLEHQIMENHFIPLITIQNNNTENKEVSLPNENRIQEEYKLINKPKIKFNLI